MTTQYQPDTSPTAVISPVVLPTNKNVGERKHKSNELKDHRANLHYRRAIIQAIDELQDFNLRSNLDAIRRYVQSSIQQQQHQHSEHNHHHNITILWNDTVFLKTVKSLIHDGDIEQCTALNAALTPEFKRRRTRTAHDLLEKRSQRSTNNPATTSPGSILPPTVTYPFFRAHHDFDGKDIPVRKTEHSKLKIIPKKIYDKQYVPVKNPMDTH